MPTDESKALVRFLIGASRTSLSEFYLHRLNVVAEQERDIGEKLHLLVENLAMVRLADFLREHGEEIADLLGAPRRRRSR